MNKLIIRMIALLLAPCVFADSTFALSYALASEPLSHQTVSSESLFTCQAFSARAVGHLQEILGPKPKSIVIQMVGAQGHVITATGFGLTTKQTYKWWGKIFQRFGWNPSEEKLNKDTGLSTAQEMVIELLIAWWWEIFRPFINPVLFWQDHPGNFAGPAYLRTQKITFGGPPLVLEPEGDGRPEGPELQSERQQVKLTVWVHPWSRAGVLRAAGIAALIFLPIIGVNYFHLADSLHPEGMRHYADAVLEILGGSALLHFLYLLINRVFGWNAALTTGAAETPGGNRPPDSASTLGGSTVSTGPPWPVTWQEQEFTIDRPIIKNAHDPDQDWITAEPMTAKEDAVQQVSSFLQTVFRKDPAVSRLFDLMIRTGRVHRIRVHDAKRLAQEREAWLNAVLQDDRRNALRRGLPRGHASDQGLSILDLHPGRPLSTEQTARIVIHELGAFLGQSHRFNTALDIVFSYWQLSSFVTVDALLNNPDVIQAFVTQLKDDGEYKTGDWLPNLRDIFERGTANMDAIVTHQNTRLTDSPGRPPNLLTLISQREDRETILSKMVPALISALQGKGRWIAEALPSYVGYLRNQGQPHRAVGIRDVRDAVQAALKNVLPLEHWTNRLLLSSLDQVSQHLLNQYVVQDALVPPGQELRKPLALNLQASIRASHPNTGYVFQLFVRPGGEVHVLIMQKNPQGPLIWLKTDNFQIGIPHVLSPPKERDTVPEAYLGDPQCEVRVEYTPEDYLLIVRDLGSRYGTDVSITAPAHLDETIIQSDVEQLRAYLAKKQSTSADLIVNPEGEIKLIKVPARDMSLTSPGESDALPVGWRRIQLFRDKPSADATLRTGTISRPLFARDQFVGEEEIRTRGRHPNLSAALDQINGAPRRLSPVHRDYAVVDQDIHSLLRTELPRRNFITAITASFAALAGQHVALFAQTPFQTISVQQADMAKVLAHLAVLLSNPTNINVQRFNAFRTPAYWQQTLQFNPALAQSVAQIVQGTETLLNQRLTQIQLPPAALNPAIVAGLLRQQLSVTVTIAQMRQENNQARRVELFATQFMNLVFDEQYEISRLIDGQRQSVLNGQRMPIMQAPTGLVVDPQIQEMVGLLGATPLARAFEAWARSLPKSYGPMRLRSPSNFEVTDSFDALLFDPLNRALESYGYAIFYESNRRPSGVQLVSAGLYRFNPNKNVIHRLDGVPVAESGGITVWRMGSIQFVRGLVNGFSIPGVKNHVVIVEDTSNQVAPGLLAIKKASSADKGPDNMFIPWDPIYKSVIDRSFPENTAPTIAEALNWEALLHELFHVWFTLKGFDQSPALLKMFENQAPSAARALRAEYAAYTGSMALSTKPLRHLMNWVLTLPLTGENPRNPVEDQLGDHLLREFSKRLRPMLPPGTLDWFIDAPQRLTHDQGLQFLRLMISSRVDFGQLQKAAQLTYQENVGPLMPLPRRPGSLLGRNGGRAATPQSVVGARGGILGEIVAMPIVEEWLRWAGVLHPFLAAHFFVWFVFVFPVIHILLHFPLVDYQVLKEDGWAALGKRMAARYAHSFVFGLASASWTSFMGLDPHTIGAIMPALGTHMINNALYKQLHTLLMSVKKAPSTRMYLSNKIDLPKLKQWLRRTPSPADITSYLQAA